jgi:hypothetical protein
MRGQLSTGEIISAAGGTLLVLSLLLPWFHEESTRRFAAPTDPTFDSTYKLIWAAVPLVAVGLALLGAVPLGNAVRRVRTGISMRPEALLAAGALAVAGVLFAASLHLGNQGSARGGLAEVTASPGWGMFISLGAALVAAAGGAIAMWTRQPGPGRTGAAGGGSPVP